MIEKFIEKLQNKNEKFLTLEVVPPASPSLNSIVEKVSKSEIDKYIDGFVVVDSPFSKLRSSSILSSIQLQSILKKPFISTLTTRDRNSIALQADLIGANYFDARLILALTGDGINLGNQKQAKAVYEGHSGYLIDIIKKLNKSESIGGYDLTNSELKPIYPFCVINSYSKDDEKLKRRLFTKCQSGAKAIFTQPIFDVERLNTLLGWLSEMPSEKPPVLVAGFFPVFSYKTAYFLYSKLPGAFIPTNWLDTLKKASEHSKEEELKVGKDLSRELFASMYKEHKKMHIMCMNNYENVVDIIKSVI